MPSKWRVERVRSLNIYFFHNPGLWFSNPAASYSPLREAQGHESIRMVKPSRGDPIKAFGSARISRL